MPAVKPFWIAEAVRSSAGAVVPPASLPRLRASDHGDLFVGEQLPGPGPRQHPVEEGSTMTPSSCRCRDFVKTLTSRTG